MSSAHPAHDCTTQARACRTPAAATGNAGSRPPPIAALRARVCLAGLGSATRRDRGVAHTGSVCLGVLGVPGGARSGWGCSVCLGVLGVHWEGVAQWICVARCGLVARCGSVARCGLVARCVSVWLGGTVWLGGPVCLECGFAGHGACRTRIR